VSSWITTNESNGSADGEDDLMAGVGRGSRNESADAGAMTTTPHVVSITMLRGGRAW
jgi:hypothetical protein